MNFKVGDKIVCIKECIMDQSGTKTTTVGKIYTILYQDNGYADDRYIIDDCNHQHWFTNSWEKWFTPVRKEKLIKLNKISYDSK